MVAASLANLAHGEAGRNHPVSSLARHSDYDVYLSAKERADAPSEPNFKLTHSQNYGKLDAAFPAGTRVPAGP
jgi:hypothetical protein